MGLLESSIRKLLFSAGAVFALALLPLAAHASVYGSGTYNSNTYNNAVINAASSTQESTVVQTPSGIEVAINLADGQAIPSTGYYITITPLNGEGKSFDKAEIYLDGKLVYTGAPDSTGTLKWFWDASKDPATKVKIIVYGPGEGITTKEFNVTVSPVESSATNMQGQEPASAAASSFPWMWILAGIGVFLLALIAIVIVLIRRHRGSSQLPPPPGPGFIQ